MCACAQIVCIYLAPKDTKKISISKAFALFVFEGAGRNYFVYEGARNANFY